MNLVDWSSQNILAVGLGSCVYLWSASTSKVTKLYDLGAAEYVEEDEIDYKLTSIINKIIETKIAIKKAGLLKFKGFMPADFITIISLSF